MAARKASRRCTASPRSRPWRSATVNRLRKPSAVRRTTMRVQDKSIIVTGSGGGIGEGIARRLAQEGARVIVNDINTAMGEKVVAAIKAAGGSASFFAA